MKIHTHTYKTKVQFALFAAFALFVNIGLAQSVTIDFNADSSIDDALNRGAWQSGGTTTSKPIAYSAGSGLGGSGAASTPVKFEDNFGYATKEAFSSGSALFTATTYLYIDTDWETGTSLVTSLGFVDTSIPDVGSNKDGSIASLPLTTQNSILSVLRFSSNGGTLMANFTSYKNAVLTGTASNGVALTVSGWYELNVTFTPNLGASGEIDIASTLYQVTSNGDRIGGAVLTALTTSTDNQSLLAAGDLYGYIGSQNGNRRGVKLIDNLSFTAIPEPASSSFIILFSIGAFAFFGISDRKK